MNFNFVGIDDVLLSDSMNIILSSMRKIVESDDYSHVYSIGLWCGQSLSKRWDQIDIDEVIEKLGNELNNVLHYDLRHSCMIDQTMLYTFIIGLIEGACKERLGEDVRII